MAYTPLYVGEIHKPLTLTWTDDTGAAVDLTGATITVRFKQGGLASTAGTGTATVTNGPAGKFTYTFSTADVATVGSFAVQFKANYGSSDNLFNDPFNIDILPVL